MAALGAGLALNWSLTDCLAGLKNLQTIPGRLEPIGNACGLTVLVDYAHSPDALHHADHATQHRSSGQPNLDAIWMWRRSGPKQKTENGGYGVLAQRSMCSHL